MGYFANATEGDMYEAQYCDHCQHSSECPIILAHKLFNYDQLDRRQESLRYALNLFIPRDGIRNGQCKMFLPMAPPQDRPAAIPPTQVSYRRQGQRTRDEL